MNCKQAHLIAGLAALLIAINPAAAQSTRSIPNFSRANLVLGDTDFAGGGTFGTSASELSASLTADIAVDPKTRKVFVADGFRVLRYRNADALTNGAAAEAVFGQGNFDTQTSPSAPNEFRFSALGLALDHKGRLWIADVNNRRVLRFDNANTVGNFPAATRVYGQPNFASNNSGFDARGMTGPVDIVVDKNDRLWVADADNNRVLRFDNISTKPNGAPADGVLGQPALNAIGTGPEGLSRSQFNTPFSLAISASGSLFVSDRDNNRVLRFDNAAALPNGANASGVLGQPDFITSSTDVLATKLHRPSGISLGADDTLWVADRFNHRALRFANASKRRNGTPADGVLGQPDFFSATQDNNSQGSFQQNSQGFLFPEFIFVDNPKGAVWVSDSQNQRVLRFSDKTPPALRVVAPAQTANSSLVIEGTAKDPSGILKVQYRVGSGSYRSAQGTTKWSFTANLKVGTNKITIIATDAARNKTTRIITITRR